MLDASLGSLTAGLFRFADAQRTGAVQAIVRCFSTVSVACFCCSFLHSILLLFSLHFIFIQPFLDLVSGEALFSQMVDVLRRKPKGHGNTLDLLQMLPFRMERS